MTNQQAKQQNKMKIALAIKQPTLCSDYSGEYFWGLLPREIEDKILKILHEMYVYKAYQEYTDRLTIPREFVWNNVYEERRANPMSKELRKKTILLEQELLSLISYSKYRTDHIEETECYLDRRPFSMGELKTKTAGGNQYFNVMRSNDKCVWGEFPNRKSQKIKNHFKKQRRDDRYYGYSHLMYRFKRTINCLTEFKSDSKMLMDISIHTPLKELKRIWKDDYGFKCSGKINNKNKGDYVNALYKYGGSIIWEESDIQ